MIIVGIAPGLRHLSYCVLGFSDEQASGVQVDSDILKTGRGVIGLDEGIWRNKVNTHCRLLEIVFERASPAIVAVGPQLDPNESELQVSVARLVLRAFAKGPCQQWIHRYYEWTTPEELGRVLGLPPSRFRQSLKTHLKEPDTIRAPQIQRAAAIAIAARVAETVPRETIVVKVQR